MNITNKKLNKRIQTKEYILFESICIKFKTIKTITIKIKMLCYFGVMSGGLVERELPGTTKMFYVLIWVIVIQVCFVL